METGIIVPTLPTAPPPPDDKSLVLDTMTEFCRNIGETQSSSGASLPALRMAKKLKRGTVQTSKKSSNGRSDAALDPDDDLLQHALENDDLDDDAMDDTPAEDVNTKPFRLEESIMPDEPNLGRGLAGALQLATQKGNIE